jgi:3',5'-nucleoside bisphosphate phosphatase
LLSAGIRTFSITDHDTVDALEEGAALARRHGLEWVPGIEITSVVEEEDVHVLGYAFDTRDRALHEFLAQQRANRVARVRAIGARLAELGVPLDVTPICDEARRDPGRSIGRPQIAKRLVERGHASSIGEAFDRWISSGRPAFVPRQGPPPRDVIAHIHSAGGIASLAHPGPRMCDEVLNDAIAAGLDAIEVFHPMHGPGEESCYLRLADERGLGVTGGSDHHGHEPDRSTLGTVALPRQHYERTMRRAAARGSPGIPARFRQV